MKGLTYLAGQQRRIGWATLFASLLVFSLSNPWVLAGVIQDQSSDLSAQTGVPLYVWRDPSFKKPVAIVVAVHGSAQQSGSMNALATALAQSGYYVVAPDVRGHGRWQLVKQPQTFDYEALVQSAADLKNILHLLQHQYPRVNIFCLGESIGVGVVLLAVAGASKQVRGLILCSAGVQPHLHNPLNLGRDFALGMARLVEPVDIRDYLNRYSSDDPRVAQEMVNDPLGRNRQTGMELLGTFNFLTREPGFAANVPSNMRALVIQGDADQVLEPASADQVFSALKTKKKQIVNIAGAGHVLIGTSFIKPSVLTLIEDWLAKNNTK